MSIRPIFLLSLPRSGSTLVQRVLAAHDGIATAPEPWLLLPQLYALRDAGVFSEYGHALSARAIGDFADRLDGGRERYWAEVRAMTERLYAAAGSPGDRWFVDKTPRYHFVADELFSVFPDAAFVFLWRNPLAVVGSTVQTWGHGRWMVERWRVDLDEGLDRLVRAFRDHRDRAYAVRFEDLVARPDSSWPALFEHLGIDFEPATLDRIGSAQVEGRMGDPTGRRRYEGLSDEPLERWKATVSTPLRKRWCRDYLRWIGRERFATMGYDLDVLLAELEAVPTGVRSLPSDVVRTTYARALRRGREAAGRMLWKTSRGGESHSVYEDGQSSSP